MAVSYTVYICVFVSVCLLESSRPWVHWLALKAVHSSLLLVGFSFVCMVWIVESLFGLDSYHLFLISLFASVFFVCTSYILCVLK